MFGRISKSSLPERAQIDWLLATYRWLLEHTGGIDELARTALVLPTPRFFPVEPDLSGHELALELFHHTRVHARMHTWPCDLVPHEDEPDAGELLGAGMPRSSRTHGAAGTFRLSKRGRARLTYSPGSVADPVAFVATMAHELGHYLMAGIPDDPPGGKELEEPATDVCAVFMGFGVFTANSAFSFQQFSDGMMQGWRSSSLGYLDERALAFALAIFLDLHGIAPGEVRKHLRTNPRTYLVHAARYLARECESDLAQLRAIRPR